MVKLVFNEKTKFFLQSAIPVWQWLPVYPLRQLHVKLLMPSTQEPPFWQVWFKQSLISVKLIRLNLFPFKTWQQARVTKGPRSFARLRWKSHDRGLKRKSNLEIILISSISYWMLKFFVIFRVFNHNKNHFVNFTGATFVLTTHVEGSFSSLSLSGDMKIFFIANIL